MPLIKQGSTAAPGTEKRIAPPPPGVNAPCEPAPTVKKTKSNGNGGNVRGQVAMHLYKAKMMSPEYAGRYVTHSEFVKAVREDTLSDLAWFEEVGLL